MLWVQVSTYRLISSPLKTGFLCPIKSVLVPQSCRTLCNPLDHNPPGSSVHGILQTRILEWEARDWTWVSCITGRLFTVWDTRKATICQRERAFQNSDGTWYLVWGKISEIVWQLGSHLFHFLSPPSQTHLHHPPPAHDLPSCCCC